MQVQVQENKPEFRDNDKILFNCTPHVQSTQSVPVLSVKVRLICRVLADIWKQGVQIEVS